MKEERTKMYKIVQIDNLNEIREILYQFDNVFKPTLTQRLRDLDLYAEKLYNNANVFAIVKKLEYVGFTAFYSNDIDNNIAYLTQIAVKPEVQNKSIGETLLAFSMKASRENGMKVIKLEVNNDNTKAMYFYRKNGFEFCEEASLNSKYMIKNL